MWHDARTRLARKVVELEPLASVTDLTIIPLLDILGLGSETRMNISGKPNGSWSWRYLREMLTPEIENRLRDLSESYDRTPT